LYKISIKNNELLLQTSLGEIKERSPYSYQIINGLKKEIDASYQFGWQRCAIQNKSCQ